MNIAQMDWDKLRIFYHIAQEGSFTRAAQKLNTTQPSLSRSIGDFESRLKMTLFYRQPLGLKLTSQGEILFHKVRDIYDLAKSALMEMEENGKETNGSLHVTANSGFSMFYLAPLIPDFLKQYPQIHLNLIGQDQDANLENFEADLAIRPHPLDNKNFTQVYLMTSDLKYYASQHYIETHNILTHPKSLDYYQVIGFGDYKNHPFLKNDYSITPNFTHQEPYAEVNSTLGRAYLAQAGFGITLLPADHPFLKNFDLVEIFPERVLSIDIFGVFSNQLKNSQRVQAFLSYLTKAMKEKGFRQKDK